MKYHGLITLLCTASFIGLYTNDLYGQRNVRWNVDGRARLSGSGCSSDQGDTFFIAADSQFAIVFTRFGVNLDDGVARTASSDCRGSIPIEGNESRFLARLDQTLAYGWAKSRGSMASITARNKWYGRALRPINININPAEEGSDAYSEASTSDDLRWGCNSRHWKRGTLDLDFSVSARRNNPSNQAITVNLYGHDLKYEVITWWQDC